MLYSDEKFQSLIQEELDREPRRSVLVDGETVLLRPLNKADGQALVDFFQSQVTDRDAETLRDDVRDPEVAVNWVRKLDYRQIFPLIALNEADDRIVGAASLHLFQGVHRHIADIRIVVGAAHRKMGLGSAMIKELIRIGDQLNLYYLKAEIPARNQSAIKAFRQLGFETKCTMEDYFLSRSDKVLDVTLMMKRLKMNLEADFFYEF